MNLDQLAARNQAFEKTDNPIFQRQARVLHCRISSLGLYEKS